MMRTDIQPTMAQRTDGLSRAPVATMLLIAPLMVVMIVVLSYQNSRYRAAAQERLAVTQQVQDATDDLLSSLKEKPDHCR